MILAAWCVFAAVLLFLSLTAHACTFFGIDPLQKSPAVMFIHVAIFPPFGAAIFYTNKLKAAKSQDMAMKAAPRPLRWLTGAFGLYAMVNFVLFVILSEGGGPSQRDGKYVIEDHGTVVREISEAEFHRKQAYIVRGFSGHWMLFATAALTLLMGVRNIRKSNPIITPPASPTPTEIAKSLERDPPEPTTLLAGIVGACFYVFCVLSSFTDLPVMGVIAAIPMIIAAVLAFRRKRGFPHKSFESVIGCLTVFPNAYFSLKIGGLVAEFIYLCVFVGVKAAVNYTVGIASPKTGPRQLTDGTPVNNHVYAALMILVIFPLFGLGIVGFSYLAEHVGRLIEVRRAKSDRIAA